MTLATTIAAINARVACANIKAMGYQTFNTQRALSELPPYYEEADFERIISDYKIEPHEIEAELETARRDAQ